MGKTNNENVIAQLKNLGIPDHEALVYLAVLKRGDCSAGDILNEVKLHREQVYRALRKLSDDGLLSKFEKKNVAYFTAVDPSVFVNRSKSQLSQAESLLPYLKTLQKEEEQIITVTKGEKAIKNQLQDM